MLNRSDEGWKKTLLFTNATIQDSIRSLNESGLQIVMVIDPDYTLIGTITDGDIRRGLLKELQLNSSITQIIHYQAIVVPPSLTEEMALHLMKTNVVHSLPVVDENKRVVGLHVFNKLLVPSSKENWMVIMAGGKGTRLLPHTENCPKPMLRVLGKPMLEHIIIRAKNEGLSHFYIAINYLGHMIEEYFEDGNKWDITIKYLKESEPLGTAGALSLIEEELVNPIIVTNGDVITDIKYTELLEYHIKHKAAATMSVRSHEWQNPFGVVKTKDIDIQGFEEKPIIYSYINAGIYALNAGVLQTLKKGTHINMPDLIMSLKEKGDKTIVYPIHETWLDVGRLDDFQKANI